MRAIDTETASAAIAMLALAIQRRLERGTTDEEIDALVERYQGDAAICSSRSTRSSSSSAAAGSGAAAAFAGQLLHVKPILSIHDGEVDPAEARAGAARRRSPSSQRQFVDVDARRRPALRVGIAHADAPERGRQLAGAGRERAAAGARSSS